MLPKAVLVALALLPVLAGCAGKAGVDGAPAPSLPPTAEEFAGNATGPVQLGFDAAAQEQGLVQEGTFAATDSCLPFTDGVPPCTGERVFDLTPMMVPDVPVQVTLALEDDAGPGVFVSVYLRLEQASATTYGDEEDEDDGGGEDVVVVVMRAGGKVEAVVRQFFFSAVPPADVHFTLEMRTVVRPDVLPTFLPIAVHLNAGETLLAAGDGLEDFVVVPPGGTASHHLGPFTYAATSAGRHVIVASGQGDIRLFGANGTRLEALLVEHHLGEPHPVSSGQDVAWEFTLQGTPLLVGLLVESTPVAGSTSGPSLHGSFHATFERLGVTVLEVDEACPTVVCEFISLGNSNDGFPGDYLDEHIGPGTYQAVARFELAQGFQVREFATFVAP